MTVLVGHKAPEFTAAAVKGNGDIVMDFSLSKEIENRYGLVFFYPLDFTFVCPSELIALDRRMEEFTKRNVSVMAVSIDSQFTHKAWRDTPINKGGIGPVKYTLVADIRHHIAQAYGVEHQEMGVSLRGAFIIDKAMVVRSQIINDLPIGRNIDEIIRTIDALQYCEQYGEVCPAGWNKGDKTIQPTSEGIANYLSENAESL